MALEAAKKVRICLILFAVGFIGFLV